MRSPSPTLNPLPRGGAKHRQPAARRPCGHTRSVTPTRTRPKQKMSFAKYLVISHKQQAVCDKIYKN
ncbi:MAG: hypothetical protein NZ455_06925 [Bacteroidia bacterium]|nr:hypothetical protein [Bacteroidia bacterium]